MRCARTLRAGIEGRKLLNASELTEIKRTRSASSLHGALHLDGETPKYRRSKTIDSSYNATQIGSSASGLSANLPRITAENFAP